MSKSQFEKKIIAITITIENRSQIDQTLILNFQPDSDFLFSIKP